MDFEIDHATSGAPLPDREILELWNASFGPEFQLSEALWLQNTSHDPSFKPEDVILARDDAGKLAGFAQAKVFRDAANYSGDDLSKIVRRGHIAAIAVRPEYRRQGLGQTLLTEAEAYLVENGANFFYAGENFRHYFPGVPKHSAEALGFFQANGYSLGVTEVDLDGPLDPAVYEPAIAAARQVTFRQGQPGDETALYEFLKRSFPGRWYYDTRLYLEQGGLLEDISLVFDQAGIVQGFLLSYRPGGKIIGPGRFWLTDNREWGGIGPLGLSQETRGLGAGLGVVGAGMRHLHEHGLKFARIDWTTLVDFYGKAGFKPSLTYQRASKPALT
jgi:ribosomal protein S18 acetylase RimI-like enzyme